MGAGLSREEQKELAAARELVKQLQVQLDAGGRSGMSSADRLELAAYRRNYSSPARTPAPDRTPGKIIIQNGDFVLQSDGSKDVRTSNASISCILSPNSCGPNTMLIDNMCVVDPTLRSS